MNGKNRYFFAVYARSKVTVKNGNRLRHSGKTFCPFRPVPVPFFSPGDQKPSNAAESNDQRDARRKLDTTIDHCCKQ